MPATLMDDVAPEVAAFVRRTLALAIGQADDFFATSPRPDGADPKTFKEVAQAGRAGLAQIDMLLKLARQVAPPAPTDDRPDPATERARILEYIEDAERRVAEHRRTHPDPEGEGVGGPDASLALRQAQGEGCAEATPHPSGTPTPPVGLTLSPSKGEADPPDTVIPAKAGTHADAAPTPTPRPNPRPAKGGGAPHPAPPPPPRPPPPSGTPPRPATPRPPHAPPLAPECRCREGRPRPSPGSG